MPSDVNRISTLVGAIAPSATLAIDAKARALKAQGVKVVSYGAGEPDFPTPGYVVEAAIAAARHWVTFPEAVALAAGVPVPIATTVADGFRVTVEQLEAACTDRTKAILFVSPSNPTGAIYGRDEVEAIGRFAVERGLWVVTDEMYEHFVYGGRVAPSMPVVVPELAERCVVINAVSKAFAMTGWRVGWLIAPPDVAAAATNLQSHTTSNVSNVSQAAALAALTGSLDFTATMRAAFDV